MNWFGKQRMDYLRITETVRAAVEEPAEEAILPPAGAESAVEIFREFAAGGRPGHLDHERLDTGVAARAFALALVPRALVVPRTWPGPRRQRAAAGKLAQVRSDLGDRRTVGLVRQQGARGRATLSCVLPQWPAARHCWVLLLPGAGGPA